MCIQGSTAVLCCQILIALLELLAAFITLSIAISERKKMAKKQAHIPKPEINPADALKCAAFLLAVVLFSACLGGIFTFGAMELARVLISHA